MMSRSAQVAIIDHSLGNLYSVRQACKHVGLTAAITADPTEVNGAEALILPGVGAFGDAMRTLRDRDLVSVIRSFAATGKPTIGVCLGLQLFMEGSEEFGEHEGLGLIPGNVHRFFSRAESRQISERLPRVPQVGWNTIHRSKTIGCRNDPWRFTPLENLPDGTFMYFVHSYYVLPRSETDILGTTTYEGFTYCSVAGRGNILGVQFHPERSGEKGLSVYGHIAEKLRGGSTNV